MALSDGDRAWVRSLERVSPLDAGRLQALRRGLGDQDGDARLIDGVLAGAAPLVAPLPDQSRVDVGALRAGEREALVRAAMADGRTSRFEAEQHADRVMAERAAQREQAAALDALIGGGDAA